MINGTYGSYLCIGHDPSQCLMVLSDAIKNIVISKSCEVFPDITDVTYSVNSGCLPYK